MTLGERIQHYRKLRGLSQEQLADLVGVTRQAVSKWELNEAMPDAAKLALLATALGVSTDCLLGLDQPPKEEVPLYAANVPQNRRGLAGYFIRLFQRRGYVAGYIIMAYGLVALAMMRLVRFAFSQMLSPVDDPFFMLGAPSGFSTAMKAPLYVVDGLSILAAAVAVTGLVLAIYWKKKTKKYRDEP